MKYALLAIFLALPLAAQTVTTVTTSGGNEKYFKALAEGKISLFDSSGSVTAQKRTIYYGGTVPNVSLATAPSSIVFGGGALTIKANGDIVFGEGVTPSEVAKIFAKFIKQYMACESSHPSEQLGEQRPQ